MKSSTAEKIKNAIIPFRNELFINEWNGIVSRINDFIEDARPEQEKPAQQRENEPVPPLAAAWNGIWSKSFNTPIAVLIIIFLVGLLVGHYVWP